MKVVLYLVREPNRLRQINPTRFQPWHVSVYAVVYHSITIFRVWVWVWYMEDIRNKIIEHSSDMLKETLAYSFCEEKDSQKISQMKWKWLDYCDSVIESVIKLAKYNRNISLLRVTVSQISTGRHRRLTSRGMSSRKYRVHTQYSLLSRINISNTKTNIVTFRNIKIQTINKELFTHVCTVLFATSWLRWSRPRTRGFTEYRQH